MSHLTDSNEKAIPSAAPGDVDEYARKISHRLQAARYMEGDCKPTTAVGWKGLNTMRCTYSVTDKKLA
jgi:hypothetical protein